MLWRCIRKTHDIFTIGGGAAEFVYQEQRVNWLISNPHYFAPCRNR